MNFYESQLFVDILLYTLYLLVIVGIGLVIWSTVRSLQLRGRSGEKVLTLGTRIAWGVALVTLCSLGIMVLMADTHPLLINGKSYTDAFWLRLSEMFINTSLLLICVAVAAVLFGRFRKV
jgi:hypothetical protein